MEGHLDDSNMPKVTDNDIGPGKPPLIELTRKQLLSTENRMRPIWTYQWVGWA